MHIKTKRFTFIGLTILAIMSTGQTGCTTMGATPSASMGKLPSKGPVGKTFRANSEKFENCARDSVTIQTGSTQHIQLKFSVDQEGSVTKATVDKMSDPDPDLQSCVLKIVKKMKFPAPNDHKTKELTYPLVLRPE